jgi:CRP-like cAMP-binding protein
VNASPMLAGHDMFHSFLPDEVERVSAFSSTRVLEKGEIIYRPDRLASHVFVLLEGEVHLHLATAAGSASALLISRVGKGQFFGIAPLLGFNRYTTFAQCAETSRVLFIEAQPLLRILKDNPIAGHQVMTVVARAYFDRYQLAMERIQRVLSDLVN